MIFKVRTSSDNEFEYSEGYGYIVDNDGNSEPTTDQMNLQDDVDNAIQEAIDYVSARYMEASNIPYVNTEHDILKITKVRYAIEKAYGLPEVY